VDTHTLRCGARLMTSPTYARMVRRRALRSQSQSPMDIGLAGVGVHTSLRLAQGSSVRLELDSAVAADHGHEMGSTADDAWSPSPRPPGSPAGAGSIARSSSRARSHHDPAEPIAIQCDGEPWLLSPGGGGPTVITLQPAGRTAVLVPHKRGDKADSVRVSEWVGECG
jgi:hypothetical protein